ncbi:MAG: hypothetical protein KAS30_00895 [Candidatus Diapherotrites archaeon]|nr:hypothetical protein [Candidatus Diapherotrites archaeon]
MDISGKRLITALFLVFLLGVLFAFVNGEYVESYGESLPMIVYGISLVSIVLGSFIVLLFQWKINEMQMNRVMKVLPSDERTIIKILLANDNKIEQNHLVVLSGMNKVKISRIISKLQSRGVVEKRNIGNTNLIFLTV